MFGQRLAKAAGAYVVKLDFLHHMDALMTSGTWVNIVVTLMWLGTAAMTGRKYERATEGKYEKVD